MLDHVLKTIGLQAGGAESQPRHAGRPTGRLGLGCLLIAGLAVLAGCSNNPYRPGETARPVHYAALGDDPKTLDPSVSYYVYEGSIVDPIYPSYFQYHYLKRNPYVLELYLGAEMPRRLPYAFTATVDGRRVRKQGEVWVFRIKRGVRFQDDPCFPGGKGREVVAADFVTSFRRMADPSVSCPVQGFLEDKIVGFAEYTAHNRARQKAGKPADYCAPVEGLQLDPRDPYTFRIALNQPYPQLRYLMAMHFTTPLAHEAISLYGKELARHPVGCGPYVLSEFIPKQRVVLKRRPGALRELYPSEGAPGDRKAGLLQDAGKPLPLVDTVVFTDVREGITGWNLFLQGYQDSWSVSQTNYQQVIGRQGQLTPEMARRGVRLVRDALPQTSYLAFNMRDAVFGGYTLKRRRLRQAISLAVDPRAFIDLFSQGRGAVSQFAIPPGIWGYEAGYRNPYIGPDLKRAKRLLAQAGYPRGIDPRSRERLVLYLDTAADTPEGRQFVKLLARQIEALGLEVRIRTWRFIVWRDRVDRGEFQLVGQGWVADYPDPENFLLLLYGPNVRPGPNASGYRNPEYDRLFEQMRAMDDGPGRMALIRRLRQVAVEDCPWVFREHPEALWLHHGWLRNVKSLPLALNSVKYLRVEGARRARLQADWNHPNYWPVVAALAFLVAGSLPAARVVLRHRGRRVRRERGA